MGLSSLFGTLYGLYFYRFRRSVNGLSEVFHYVPFTLLAVVILTPVLSSDKFTEAFRYTSSEREIAEILVLALLAVPVVSAQIGNIIGEISRRDFIISAKVLGASRLQIFRREISPHILPRFWLISLEQWVQTLIILAHLGVFNLFFGGTLYQDQGHEQYSLTDEWSGLIGHYRKTYMTGSIWMFFAPIIMFALTIMALNLMIEGMTRASNHYQSVLIVENESTDWQPFSKPESSDFRKLNR
ncbi:MAG: ABC transporter permease subunit [Sporolactobacillus sp.]